MNLLSWPSQLLLLKLMIANSDSLLAIHCLRNSVSINLRVPLVTKSPRAALPLYPFIIISLLIKSGITGGFDGPNAQFT